MYVLYGMYVMYVMYSVSGVHGTFDSSCGMSNSTLFSFLGVRWSFFFHVNVIFIQYSAKA
jgi:hypothetical protein